jgi:hypothetical protein
MRWSRLSVYVILLLNSSTSDLHALGAETEEENKGIKRNPPSGVQ